MDRYYVLRVRVGVGGDECEICKENEHLINSSGGAFFTEEEVMKAISPDSNGFTHLFHPNCRCTIIPAHGFPIEDEVDRLVVFSGAIGRVSYGDLSEEDQIRIAVLGAEGK